MKIVHLLKHCRDGNGSVHVAVDLACAQAADGHDVSVVSSGGTYDELLQRVGVQVHLVPLSEGIWGALQSFVRTVRLIRASKPDIIHAHMMASAIFGFVASKLVKAKLVTTMHNSFDRHSFLMNLGDVVVAVSEAERRLLISRGFSAKKVVTVLNGSSGSQREGLEGRYLGPIPRPAIITLSGLHPRKAVDDVIVAFTNILSDFSDWHLVIVGDGPDRQRLENMAMVLGVSSNVHFLGSTLTPRALLEEADVFVTATLADPCPLTVGEARTARCAIIASDVGGIPETLEGGRAGMLVPPSSPIVLGQVLRQLLSNREKMEQWQTAAFKGSGYLTVDRVAKDYMDVYENVSLR